MWKIKRSQVPLSRSSGGQGLRSPQLFEPTAKISSLSGKGQWMTRFFPAHYNYNTKLQEVRHCNINYSLNNNSNENNDGNNNSNKDNGDERKDDSSDLVNKGKQN